MKQIITISLVAILFVGSFACFPATAEDVVPEDQKESETNQTQEALKPGIEQITLRVDGLACPFCAYGLEKKIRRLEGYKTNSYTVRINAGEVLFRLASDEPLDLAAVRESVDKAGFTLRKVRLVAVGKIVREDGIYFLALLPSIDQRFYLYQGGATEEETEQGDVNKLTHALRERLDQAIGADRFVRIAGAVHAHKDKALPLALDIESAGIVRKADAPNGNAGNQGG